MSDVSHALRAAAQSVSGGEGRIDWSLTRPMAIAIIGGLASLTLLTLLVVPVMFLLLARLNAWLAQVRHRLRHETPALRARLGGGAGHR